MKKEYIKPEATIVLLTYSTTLLSNSLEDVISTGINEEDAILLGGDNTDEVISR
jgi:hypothetical protein